MKQKLSLRLFVLGIALGAIGGAAVLVAAAYGGSSSGSTPKGALVALGKTTLGPILVDARGRTTCSRKIAVARARATRPA
jgi:hypothetical protein